MAAKLDKKIVETVKPDKTIFIFNMDPSHKNPDAPKRTPCMCSECKKEFNWSPHIDFPASERLIKDSYSGYTYTQYLDYATDENGERTDESIQSVLYRQGIGDIECPYCHQKAKDGFVIINSLTDESTADITKPGKGAINLAGAIILPPLPRERQLIEYNDDKGDTKKIEDVVTTDYVVLFPKSGKKYAYSVELKETTDLGKGKIDLALTRRDSRGKTTYTATAPSDSVFEYGKKHPGKFDKKAHFGIKSSLMDKCTGIEQHSPFLAPNKIMVHNDMHKVMGIEREYSHGIEYSPLKGVHIVAPNPNRIPGISDNEPEFVIQSWSEYSQSHSIENAESIATRLYSGGSQSFGDRFETCELDPIGISNKKLKLAEKRLDAIIPDEIYRHSAKNTLLVERHRVGSTEENSELSPEKIRRYYEMIVKYPAAVSYAAERADERCLNFEYGEKRRQNENPDYNIRTLPDSAKARIFREEMEFVSEQLGAVDDKILATITKCKDATEMREKLSFFVFGAQDPTKSGKEVEVPKGVTVSAETAKNSIAVTKALRSEYKRNPIGLANTAYTGYKLGIRDVNALNKLVEIAKEAKFTPSHAPHFKHISHDKTPFKNSETHRYVETIAPIRNVTAMRFLKEYFATHNHTQAIDDIYGSSRNFDEAMECMELYGILSANVDIASTTDSIETSQHDIEKQRFKKYLEHKTIKDAYVDYILKYGDKTKETIDGFAREIKKEKHSDEMFAYYKEHGTAATGEKYPDFLAERTEKEWESYSPTSETKIVLTPRNGKALFPGNNLGTIHDELSYMLRKAPNENRKIEYTDKEREFEGSYEAPDGSGTWQFCLHEDTNDMIRTATECSNCLAGHSDSAVNKYTLYLYMTNELGKRIACISLKKAGTGYRVDEFQGPHDNAVDLRYKDVCMQWLDEKEISYKGNSNVEQIGTNASFYGDRNVDYHSLEVEETTGRAISATEMKAKTEERIAKAKEIYGITDDGHPNIPDAPDDLTEFQ